MKTLIVPEDLPYFSRIMEILAYQMILSTK